MEFLPMVLSKFLGDGPIFICKKTMLHYNCFLNILYAVFNEYCID